VDAQGTCFFDAVPTGLNHRVMNFGFAFLKRDSTDGILRRHTSQPPKIVAQFSLHERQPPAERIRKKRLACAIGSKDRPVLVPLKYPGGILKNQSLAEPEGRPPQGKKRSLCALGVLLSQIGLLSARWRGLGIHQFQPAARGQSLWRLREFLQQTLEGSAARREIMAIFDVPRGG